MTLETVLYSKILIQSSSLVPIAIHALDVMSVLCVEVYLESHVSEVRSSVYSSFIIHLCLNNVQQSMGKRS